MSGTLVHIPPSGAVVETRWEGSGPPDLEILKKAVGGWIERVKVKWDGRTRDGYVDEEGLLKNLTFNLPATRLTKGTIFEGSLLHGNLVIWVPDRKVKL